MAIDIAKSLDLRYHLVLLLVGISMFLRPSFPLGFTITHDTWMHMFFSDHCLKSLAALKWHEKLPDDPYHPCSILLYTSTVFYKSAAFAPYVLDMLFNHSLSICPVILYSFWSDKHHNWCKQLERNVSRLLSCQDKMKSMLLTALPHWWF